MSRFMLIFRGGAVVNGDLSSDDRRAQVARWTEWMKRLELSGNYLPGGAKLQNEGIVVRGDEREAGPGFVPDAQLVTGTYFLEADSLAAAGNLAKGCPILRVGGSVEVRSVLERISGEGK